MPNKYNPITNPVDYILVATETGYIQSPGIATIYDGDSKRKWEEITSRGYTGSFSRFLNTEAAHFRVECKLLSDEDWERFHLFHAFVMKAPKVRGTSQDALGYFSIYHPLLSMMGITAAGVESVGQPVGGENGEYLYSVKFIQYLGRPKVTLAKPDAEKPAGPESPIQAEIRKRVETVKELAAYTPKR